MEGAKYFNRELSWIEFNARVLHEATRKDLPLLERLKFLAITASNFDEFFQVRVASIKRQFKENPYKTDASGLTPAVLLKKNFGQMPPDYKTSLRNTYRGRSAVSCSTRNFLCSAKGLYERAEIFYRKHF